MEGVIKKLRDFLEKIIMIKDECINIVKKIWGRGLKWMWNEYCIFYNVLRYSVFFEILGCEGRVEYFFYGISLVY